MRIEAISARLKRVSLRDLILALLPLLFCVGPPAFLTYYFAPRFHGEAVVTSAVKIFASWLIVIIVYFVSRSVAAEHAKRSKWNSWLSPFAACCVLVLGLYIAAFMAGSLYRDPPKSDEDPEPYQGRPVSQIQANDFAARFFLILLFPSLFGIVQGYRSQPKTRTSKDVFEWFQKHRSQLLERDYDSSISSVAAHDIVDAYAGVQAIPMGLIRDVNLLPYPKETIRSAINRRIEDLIEENGGRDAPLTPELERTISALGGIKNGLMFFQYIDPQDKEAIEVWNSCPEQPVTPPESADEKERIEFQRWWLGMTSKYSRRAGREMERSAETTITVGQKDL
jgi:hypothetical protein